MKLFSCPACGGRLYFENDRCLACGTDVALAPEESRFVAVGVEADGCRNATECGCNWIAAPEHDGYCRACALNRTIPDLAVDGNRDRWARIERAKRRLVYALLGFGLDVHPKSGPGDAEGLAFEFLADLPGERVLTGHDGGLITLNVIEADPAERERMRLAMGERYRTLLGHFRHEVGHYYWERLIRDDPAELEAFRALFGDDREDYAEALRLHYEEGPSAGWQDSHVTPYAASHPWEDWAETWAHYLHITDTLEMADAFAIPIDRIDAAANAAGLASDDEIDAILLRWLALTEVVNGINRCMGVSDLYPFVIASAVARKLDYVRLLLERQR
ncbi:putative zinc-binding metallopeptidase [Aquibium sp. ELW1220]|uniref:zinc-binding metallopeptidase family protein n=1 Tax=Aquibium sp. ELW1220 TaxID=2976766 RepID=UPI0025B01E76|nr:putative zinc-binding metallopeptidase [Aquibium sp. ELW1220]MDN2579958.1 putative zinc-binding peptidase [Aquibium sp. ELW1220]